MEHLPISEAQWIRQQTKPWPQHDLRQVGITLENLLPSSYESYGKLFHPFIIDPTEPNALGPNPTYGKQLNIAISHNADGGISITEQRADGTVVDLQEEAKRREEMRQSQQLLYISWRSVAEKYGLVFHDGINLKSYAIQFQRIGWPQNLLFPSEGRLPRALLIELLAILRQHTPKDEVYIYQAFPHTLFNEEVVRCSFEEVTQYFRSGLDYVGYMYAGDRSWTVFTDNDLHYTVIGCSKTLLGALKDSPLEVLECSATSRVDNFSDRLNEPPPQLSSPPLHQELRPCRLGKEPLVPKRHSIFNQFMRWLTGK